MKNESIEKFKDTMCDKHGVVCCESPDGEYFEARSFREAAELSGVHRNTIDYATKHSGRTRGGWKFWRKSIYS